MSVAPVLASRTGDTKSGMLPHTVTPKPDRPLTRDEVRELQALLRKQGFDAGMPDGIIGPKTRAATQAFARAPYKHAGQGFPAAPEGCARPLKVV